MALIKINIGEAIESNPPALQQLIDGVVDQLTEGEATMNNLQSQVNELTAAIAELTKA